MFYNPNPVQARAGDCAVRAVSKALGISWEKAYMLIAEAGYLMGDIMSSDIVWGSVLRQNGFKRAAVPDCPECPTVRDFAQEHGEGTYVVKTDGHVVTVSDGNWYDTWDTGDEPALYYWYKEADVQ